MSQTDAFIVFAFWCAVGWLLIYVRNSHTKMSYTMFNSSGYKKTAEVFCILTIVLWPISLFVAIAFSHLVLWHLKRKK